MPKKKKKSRKGIKLKSKNGKARGRAGRLKQVSSRNIKQRIFAKKVAEGQSQKAAAIAAGYAVSGAAVQGSRLIRNANVQAIIVATMEAQGLDDKTLLEVLKSGLSATKLFGSEGVEHTDFPTRLHAVRLAYELKGVIGKSRNEEEAAHDQTQLLRTIMEQIAGVIHQLVTDKGLKRKIALAIQKIADRMRYEEAKRIEREG